MKWLVISNETEVPIASLEMLGGTDKKMGGFIGKFGSGCKMAIAAAIRNNIDIRICTGTKIIKFNTVGVQLNRASVQRITMQINNNTPKERDWTINMGDEDWRNKPNSGLTIDWMIFREFFSNALDEGKANLVIEDRIQPEEGKTKVYIRYTDAIKEIIDKLSLYYPRIANVKRSILENNKYGRIYNASGSYGAIYCNGVFVCRFQQRLLYDYDFDFLTLSESRTVDPYYFNEYFSLLLSECSSEFLARFFVSLNNERENCYEYSIPEHHLTSRLSHERTKSAFETAFGQEAFLCPPNLATSTDDALSRVQAPRIIMKDSWRNSIVKSGVRDYISLLDNNIVKGYQYISDDEVNVRVDPELQSMAKIAFEYCVSFFQVKNKPELRFFEWTGDHSSVMLGHCSGNVIGLNYKTVRILEDIIDILAEEFAHYVSGAPDLSRALVSTLTKYIAKNAMLNITRNQEEIPF